MSLLSKLSTLKRALADRRSIPFYVQRRFMSARTRARIGDWVASRRPPKSCQDRLDQDIASKLKVQGIAHLGGLLTKAQVKEIRDYLAVRPVEDAYRPDLPHFEPESTERRPDCHVAFHFPDDILAAPHLLELANRPELLAVAEDFLGCKPLIGYLTAWWSYPTSIGPQQAENFHRDVDDWKFLKLFVYLTDVGDENGPHVYVKASAPDPALRRIGRFTDEEVEAAFGADRFIRNCGAAGTGFFENTFGVHKGQPPEKGIRLLFQVVYCLTPLPYGAKEPVARITEYQFKNISHLDKYTNSVYIS